MLYRRSTRPVALWFGRPLGMGCGAWASASSRGHEGATTAVFWRSQVAAITATGWPREQQGRIL
ncbi:hypothetical protein ACNKHL_04320 [Shigella flexneri]